MLTTPRSVSNPGVASDPAAVWKSTSFTMASSGERPRSPSQARGLLGPKNPPFGRA
jgi:hypothetical protein